MLKKCKDCGNVLGKDKKSGHFWCTSCKEVKEEYSMKYKICILGKNTGKESGRNNFINRLGDELVKLEHEVIPLRFGELYDYIPMWNLTECFVNKKKISLRFIDHVYSPDFIIVEQTYNRFDIDGITCPVIYIHREYTHFPDIENPDMLLGSYPNRLQAFEFYYPNQYSQIPYCDELLVAVDPDTFNPNREKLIKGITMLGWATNPYNFANANGIFARMVIEDQVAFYQDCIKKGYCEYINGGKFLNFKNLLEQCEAILIDGGYINAYGRRLFEAMASKTLCIVRVHGVQTKQIYEKLGLTDDMCYFVYDPEDIGLIQSDWDLNTEKHKKMVDKAYDWVMNNHIYKCRAKKLIEKFEEFKKGMRKKEKFMGYALHSDIQIKEGEIIHTELI